MGKFTSYKILAELNLIICNFQGDISIREVIDLNLLFMNDPEFDPLFNVMLDFRNSSAIGFRLDITDYVAFLKKNISFKVKVKVGIVYSTPNQEFLLKFYKGFGKFLNLDIEIFKQVSPCLNWLGFSDFNADLISDHLNSIKSSSVDI
jgi:hypothetical protein